MGSASHRQTAGETGARDNEASHVWQFRWILQWQGHLSVFWRKIWVPILR